MRTTMMALALAVGVVATSISAATAGPATASAPAASQPTTAAGPGANGLAPAKTFTAKDLPEPEKGKPAWKAGNQWSYGIALHDKWLYAASVAEYILQFEVNPATAGMEYLGATPFGYHETEAGVGVGLLVRKLSGGNAMLYLRYGSHGPGVLAWFAVDAKTGKLTPKGQQSPPKVAVGHLTPDAKRAYSVGGNKITWCRFEEDGTPVEEGSAECKDIGHYGQSLLTADGRHLYTLIDPPTMRLDAYACDEKTGKPTFIASVDLAASQQRVSGMMPLSPDGKHLYVFNGGWDEKNVGTRFTILQRDVDKGTLTILSSGQSPASFDGLGGPGWSRMNRFAFMPDGKSGAFLNLGGYYHRPISVGTFTCDPATGALTAVSAIGARGQGGAQSICRLALDTAHGNLFTVGESICSFKAPPGIVGSIPRPAGKP